MIARIWAREIATFKRFLLKRNWIPRGEASPSLAVMEKITTGASWPWNLSTLPTRPPQQRRQTPDLEIIRRHHQNVSASHSPLRTRRQLYILAQQFINDLANNVSFRLTFVSAASCSTGTCDKPARRVRYLHSLSNRMVRFEVAG